MSEFHPSTSGTSVDFQLESLIADVESKFIAAEDALSELRHAVRGLKSYRPPALPEAALQVAPAAQPVFGAEPETTRDKVTPAHVEAPPPAGPKLEDETVGVPFWSGPKTTEPEPDLNPRRREYEMDSTSEGSWPIVRPAAAGEAMRDKPVSAEPEPVTAFDAGGQGEATSREQVSRSDAQMQDSADAPDESSSAAETAQKPNDEAARRDVAKMVASLRDSIEEEPEGHEEVVSTQDEADDETRQDVARMVTEMRGAGLDAGEPEAATEEDGGDDDEALRQEVARTVAEMQAGILDAPEEAAGSADNKGDETRREGVADMVAQLRAELAGGVDGEEGDEAMAPADSDMEVRDEVRRAVDAARAEMASGYNESEGGPGSGAESKFSFTDWQSTRIEPSGPPVIVIKDSEGRVELARVYETLSRVNCDENAALLNYTPHSVTVGLNVKAAIPETEALSEAVRAVFGRACEVDSDGVRLNVQIGKDLKGKDSAA